MSTPKRKRWWTSKFLYYEQVHNHQEFGFLSFHYASLVLIYFTSMVSTVNVNVSLKINSSTFFQAFVNGFSELIINKIGTSTRSVATYAAIHLYNFPTTAMQNNYFVWLCYVVFNQKLFTVKIHFERWW